MTTPQWPVLANVAAAGAMAGMQVGRQPTIDASGVASVPADFAAVAACAKAFGSAVDAALLAICVADGTPTGLGANGGIISAATTTMIASSMTTAAETNVAETYPAALQAMCQAITSGRGIPTDSSGVAYTQADWAASGIANAVAAQFYEYVSAGIVSAA
jgi:hypothetical protein